MQSTFTNLVRLLGFQCSHMLLIMYRVLEEKQEMQSGLVFDT